MTDLILVPAAGKVQRTPLEDVPRHGRVTYGRQFMKMKEVRSSAPNATEAWA